MQATYIIAVNKQALQWLPPGADVRELTYDQYLAWARAAQGAAGRPVFGIPAGPKGLFYRFIQGYLLPSFTGGQVTTFRGADAEAAWTYMTDLWAATAPASTNYEYMQEPLARGEVLVAWDHVARLVGATKDKPDDWLMVPAPRGPKGRGYMLVLAGLALPKGGLERPAAEQVIRGIAAPGMQVETLRQNAFFPVTSVQLPADLPGAISGEAAAVMAQSGEPRRDPLAPAGRAGQPRRAGGAGVQGLLPGDLPGPQAGRQVLDEQAERLYGAARRREGAVLVPRPGRPGLRGGVMAAPTLDRDTEAPARRTRRARKGPSGLLLIAPSLVFMALLFGWPMVQGVLQAFRGDQGFTLEFVQRMVDRRQLLARRAQHPPAHRGAHPGAVRVRHRDGPAAAGEAARWRTCTSSSGPSRSR